MKFLQITHHWLYRRKNWMYQLRSIVSQTGPLRSRRCETVSINYPGDMMNPDASSGSLSLVDLIRCVDGSRPSLHALSGEPLSFADLRKQVDYVGSALRAAGIGKTNNVAVILPNGPVMASAFLGVASFSTCAPLNPQYGSSELEFYLSDLDAAAVVLPASIDSPVRRIAKNAGITVLDLEVLSARTGEFCFNGFDTTAERPGDPGTNDDIAMILHTSGTTSRPKKVPLTHRNLCSSAISVARTLALTPDDICLNVMPLFHIHGLVGVLLSSMGAGGSVICPPGFDADQFGSWIVQHRPTWYSAVPTIHQAIIGVTRESSVGTDHSLRFIRSSSSSLPPQVLFNLESIFGVPVIESYGMTEAAHQMASNPLPPVLRKPGSVGLPAGPAMGIMDDAGNLLPDNHDGEIVIRGPNVTSGYCENPEANAVAFANSWFRTGDLGRRDHDGYFFINGRKKEMINRGGENISPREIDEVLLEHASVSQAIAFAIPHATLGEDVAAAVVLRDGSAVNESELRQFAIERLAPFKVPSRIVFVDSIPKGPTGKLQRIGLHEKLGVDLRQALVAPRTEMEEALARLWCEVLMTERIGIHHNFFGLGGDSLTAGRLVARINSQFGLNAAITIVFRAPSIETLAVVIESMLLDQIESEQTR